MPKRKCTKKQLRNLAKGRAKRLRNLKKRRKRPARKRKRKPIKRRKPMAKRRRTSNTLTGGTGDVNPQFMTLQFTPAIPGVVQTVPFITAINRLPSTYQKLVVMEVLKVFYEYPDCPPVASAIEIARTCTMGVSTQDHGTTPITWAMPDVFSMNTRQLYGAFTALGSIVGQTDQMIVQDLTDGCGHGVLVATDTIYGQLSGDVVFATHYKVKILYRMKNVTLTEYIGIVQSQQ